MREDLIDFQLRPSSEALKLIGFKQAKKHRVLPIRFEQGNFLLAVSTSTDVEYLDFLRQYFNCEISQILTPEIFLNAAIQHYFKDEKPDSRAVDHLQTNTPTALLTEKILLDAIEKNCSDIHIEPFRKNLVIRYRKDGFLKTTHHLELHWHLPLIAYLKLKGQLNIAEKRRPQEGSFEYANFNARLSCVPSLYGEAAVVRLLPPSNNIPDFETLGLHYHNEFLENFYQSNGFIAIAGPTGSGKTTTLYAMILRLAAMKKRILTIEDPVEYSLPNVSQINLPASESVENILRAIVRQNVDVLVVGELRSYDRLQVALNAALTGHLVLSTVHAKNATQAVDRLIYMGASENLLESTLRYVVGQRLVRRPCQKCSEGSGCESCLYTGFDGRVGVFEIFRLNSDRGSKGIKSKLVSIGHNLSENQACLPGSSIISIDGARSDLASQCPC